MLKNKHLIEPEDFTLEELERIFKLAKEIIEDENSYKNFCNGKILGTLFYEPSTRTRFSFEAAMLRLGGQVVGFSESLLVYKHILLCYNFIWMISKNYL